MPEGLSTAEVGKEIGEHRHHAGTHQSAGRHGRVVSITEAVLLSIVAIIAAWSGYSAAKWGTESSLELAKASATRTKANRAHPFTNPNAPPGPQAMPQYHAAGAAQSKLLDSQADTYYADGQKAAETADKYIRTTVILASVLFLVGISTKFPLVGVRYGLVGVGAVLLIFAVEQILQLPRPPGS